MRVWNVLLIWFVFFFCASSSHQQILKPLSLWRWSIVKSRHRFFGLLIRSFYLSYKTRTPILMANIYWTNIKRKGHVWRTIYWDSFTCQRNNLKNPESWSSCVQCRHTHFIMNDEGTWRCFLLSSFFHPKIYECFFSDLKRLRIWRKWIGYLLFRLLNSLTF